MTLVPSDCCLTVMYNVLFVELYLIAGFSPKDNIGTTFKYEELVLGEKESI